MSFTDIGIKEDCCYRLSFESGPDIELLSYVDPISSSEHLRISDSDLTLKVFDPLIGHVTRYLNSTRKRILLDHRKNPRYKPADIRQHLVVLVSDAHNARTVLQPSRQIQLCCQVLSIDGAVAIPNMEQYEPALGRITQSIPITL